MKQRLKLPKSRILIFIAIFLFNCSNNSDDECTKTIAIPQVYFINNQSYTTSISQEVDCDFPEPTTPEVIEPPRLEDFTYTVLSSSLTLNSTNNTSRLQFEVELNNNSTEAVNGIPYFTIFTNVEFMTASYANDANNACTTIGANSSCVFSYDVESPDNGTVTTTNFDINNVEYLLIN